MSTVQASVIIPVRNGEKFITHQLDALAAQINTPTFEVIVSDNGSTDATRRIVENYRAPYLLRLIDSSQRPGICTARNIGVLNAQAEIILFCDADDYVEPEWLSAHLKAHTQHPQSLVAGTLIYGKANTAEILSAYGYSSMYDSLPHNTAEHILTAQEINPQARHRPCVSGCNFSVSKQVYMQVGGMDTTYVGGSEEIDFSWRVQDAGHPIYKTCQARVNYKLRQNARGIFKQQRGYQSTMILLWTRFKNEGIYGGSTKFSLQRLAQYLPQLLSPRRRLHAAFIVGGNVGALEGIFTYRFLGKIPARELMEPQISTVNTTYNAGRTDPHSTPRNSIPVQKEPEHKEPEQKTARWQISAQTGQTTRAERILQEAHSSSR